jgi:hypothetical protein
MPLNTIAASAANFSGGIFARWVSALSISQMTLCLAASQCLAVPSLV